MKNNEKENNKGCWLGGIILIVGIVLIFSPLNPFYETVGEDDFMTNSSWLVNMVLLGALLYFVINKFKNKD